MSFSAGVFTPFYNFTNEAASPPISIDKLTTQFSDIAAGLSNCILRDGTGLPTSAISFGGQNVSAVGTLSVNGATTMAAAMTLTTGSANATGITYTGSGAGIANIKAVNTSASTTARAGLDLSDNSTTGGITFNGSTNTGSFPTGTAAGNCVSVFCASGPVQLAPGNIVSLAGTTAGRWTIGSGAAIAAGGAASTGIMFTSTSTFGVFVGSGAPTMTAAKGSLYLRSDGSTTNDRAYINTNGSTTWTALTTVA